MKRDNLITQLAARARLDFRERHIAELRDLDAQIKAEEELLLRQEEEEDKLIRNLEHKLNKRRDRR